MLRHVRYRVYAALFLVSVLISVAWAVPSYSQEAAPAQPAEAPAETKAVVAKPSPPEPPPNPKAATTNKDVSISLDELKLLLKPMTLTELNDEAAGWLQVLQDKAKEVSKAEVTIQRQNSAIQKQHEAADQLEKAQQALKEAENAQKGAAVGSPQYQEATKKIEEAKDNLKKAQDSVEKAQKAKSELDRDQTARQALDASKKTGTLDAAKQVLDQLKASRDKINASSPAYAEETKKVDRLTAGISAVEKAQELQQAAKPNSPEAAKAGKAFDNASADLDKVMKEIGAANPSQATSSQAASQHLNNATAAIANTNIQSDTGTAATSGASGVPKLQNLQQKQQQLEKTTKNLQKSADTEAQAKNQLVANATELQSQVTAIADRLNVVLDELERKGGDPKSYRDYLKGVTTVNVDAKDTEGLGVRTLAWLQSEQGGMRWAENIAKFFGIVFATILLSQILGFILDRLLALFSRNVSRVLRKFVVALVKRGGVLVGFLLGLTALEVSLGPVLALLGGVSFVLAFALQSNLGNLASGLMIMLNKPFDVGDEIKLGELWGWVESISLANTKLKGFHGQMYTIPNNEVWGSTIENLTHEKLRKVIIPLAVPFDENLVRVEELMVEILSSHPLIEKDPPPETFTFTIESYYINLICGGWTKTDGFWEVHIDLIHIVKERFDREGIKLAAIPKSIQYYSQFDPKSINGKMPPTHAGLPESSRLKDRESPETHRSADSGVSTHSGHSDSDRLADRGHVDSGVPEGASS